MFISTDSTSCHEFASQFSLEICLCAKNIEYYREYRVAHDTVYLHEAATGHSTAAKRKRIFVMVGRTDPSNSDNQNGDVGGLGNLVRACVRACVHACMHACVMCLQYTIIIF